MPGSVSPNPEIPQPGSGIAALPSTNTSTGAASEKIPERALSLEMGTGDAQLILRWLPCPLFFPMSGFVPSPAFLCELSCCAADVIHLSQTHFFFLKSSLPK